MVRNCRAVNRDYDCGLKMCTIYKGKLKKIDQNKVKIKKIIYALKLIILNYMF